MSDGYTPGPWAWTYDGSGDYSIGAADDPQVSAIASVYAWGRDYDKAAANCRLLAASPDLLAAARCALGTLLRQLRSEELTGAPFCGDDEHEAIRVLSAAIAKAAPSPASPA